MANNKAPRKAYRRRLIKIPMTGMRDEIALQLHGSFSGLRLAPNVAAFDAVGAIINMVGTAIQDDARFHCEAKVIASGASAMNQIGAKVSGIEGGLGLHLQVHELRPIQSAVNTIDEILPRLDLTKLHIAEKKVRAMRPIEQQKES